ncbi:MAG TPA: ABC transporter permease subunit, partial [Solirubrobacterales bacterium]|nr:ABC transporter permease subunit [Solirubrobacterales bacterium]
MNTGGPSAGAQIAALVATHLSDRRRSVLAWGLPLGLMSAFIVAIFPSVEESLTKAIRGYPQGLKEAFGIGQLSNVEQYLHAEMLSLIVPLAMGYLAVRAIAGGLTGAAESGRLDVVLSAPVSRSRVVLAGFLATAVELAAVLAVTGLLCGLGSLLAGSGLDAGRAAAGFADVWPLALLFAGSGLTMWLFLRTWASPAAITLGVVIYVFFPYHLYDLFVRGALPEFAAFL